MTITPSLFEAFLKCPTKCWLRFTGEPPTGNTYSEWVQAEQESYRGDAVKRTSANAPADGCAVAPIAESLKTAKWQLAIDVPVRIELRSNRGNEAKASTSGTDQNLLTAAATDAEAKSTVESRLHAVERIPSEGRGKAAQFIPVRFIFINKLGKDEKLLLAFDAFVLSEMLGREVTLGKIIHGDNHVTLKVKTATLAGEVRKRLEKIAALLSSPAPPDLVLNRHCAECEFQARCRKIAVEKDDLSLLSSMSAKERQKFRSKGIFTVTQLSYTFRPRRRPKRLRDKREQYHHSLKALAIREKKIHIVGSPEPKIEGTPVYLDVEGLPDRDFYYLIGLRVGEGESAVQHSLWADTVEDEGKIWREFLAILETVEKPVLIHYGSYETTFLKRMCEQHGKPPQGSTAAEALPSAVNVLSYIFGQIYFAGLSNGLKDTANTLGFKWAEEGFSGLNAIASRCQWETSHEEVFKELLTAYNVQDCEALSLVADTVRQLGVRVEDGDGTGAPSVVRADTNEFPKRSKWRTFTSPVAGFERVNATAHWDYHRHRVYVRTGKPPRKVEGPHRETRRQKRVQLVIASAVSRCCPKCKRMVRLKGPQRSITVHDILFGRHSMKRRVVTYVFQTYRCWKCRIGFGVEERFRLFRQYGWNLVSYLCYHVIELNINQATVLRSFNRLFGFDLSKNTLNNMKVKAARYYAQTKQKILEHIVQGNLAHADETRANIHGQTGFVWVLTSHNEVVYVLADSREGEMAQKLLAGFKGVLVSDFYTAYDSIGCSQQRCLIHLIRDLNDEVLNNPFDTELKHLVTLFAELVKQIVETVDRHGLKRHFLRRHLANVDHFYEEIDKTECRSEATTKCKERFERNRDKLFTFLNYDGVPWHNNNAEHAIKAFARLREVIAGGSTAKGLEEYLTLLSLSQTCNYMGVDFLDFLRSGEKDIHAFAQSRGGRRKRMQTCQPTESHANVNSNSGETVASQEQYT